MIIIYYVFLIKTSFVIASVARQSLFKKRLNCHGVYPERSEGTSEANVAISLLKEHLNAAPRYPNEVRGSGSLLFYYIKPCEAGYPTCGVVHRTWCMGTHTIWGVQSTHF